MKIALDLTDEELGDLALAITGRSMTLTGMIARTPKKTRAPLEARLALTKGVWAKLNLAIAKAAKPS